jgi:phage gp16-like protein
MNPSNSKTAASAEISVMTKQKLAVLHVAKKQLQLSDDNYLAILRETGGVASAKDLSEHGFEAVMLRFYRMGFRSTWNARNFGYRPGMATPRQVAMIRALWNEFTKGQGTDQTLGKWLSNKFGVSSVRFLDAEKARQVGGALKRMTGQVATPRPRKRRQKASGKTPGGDE